MGNNPIDHIKDSKFKSDGLASLHFVILTSSI